MSDRVANPKALGFSAFAIVAWMYSMLNAGWYTSGGSAITAFVTLALVALFIAALVSFLRNEPWHAVFFMFWAALLWGNRAAGMGSGMGAAAYHGWYSILVAVISLFLLLAAMRIAAGAAVVLLNLGITLVFLGLALHGWTGAGFWSVIAGYIGLATGLAALWAAWSEFAAMGGGESSATAA